MSLRTFVSQKIDPAVTKIELSKDESFHLLKVLRAKKGEEIQLYDGAGHCAFGEILDTNVRIATICIKSVKTFPKRTPQIELAVCLPKGSLIEDIIKHSVEIGVSAIHPILSDRTENKWDEKKTDHKLERWNSIAIEALKQSGNPFLLKINPPIPFKNLIEREATAENTLKLTASLENNAQLLSKIFNNKNTTPPSRIIWFIGPEGDFSPTEYAQLQAINCLPIRLSPYVMRVPIAALYCATISDQIQQTFNDSIPLIH